MTATLPHPREALYKWLLVFPCCSLIFLWKGLAVSPYFLVQGDLRAAFELPDIILYDEQGLPLPQLCEWGIWCQLLYPESLSSSLRQPTLKYHPSNFVCSLRDIVGSNYLEVCLSRGRSRCYLLMKKWTGCANRLRNREVKTVENY